MPKSISTELLAHIQKAATRLAVCVEIRRKDGRVLRLTNHDTDITLQGNRFRHDIPFSLSAIETDSSLNVDTTELTLLADGEVVSLEHIKRGLYEYAETRIFMVDFSATADGEMSLRKGWFGNISYNENRIVRVTITGLLKVLDFVVGRTYQPSCDADLGDARCMVAIDHSQIYSRLNPYNLGNWVYRYDLALTTPFDVVNPSFEDDGVVAEDAAITGWTRTRDASESYIAVKTTSDAAGDFTPIHGTYMLVGTQDFGIVAPGQESGVYQDIDLLTATTGLTVAKIDDGRVFVGYIVSLMQGLYLLDPIRALIEIRDNSGTVIDFRDTGYLRFDTFDQWRDRGLVFPLLPGSRTARIYIMFRKDDGEVYNHGADDVRFFWWDHTLGNPYSGVVHRLSRIGAFADDALKLLSNDSFEVDEDVTNANGPAITGWTTGSGNWWQVIDDAGGGGLPDVHGSYYLRGGDDGGATQRTYQIFADRLLGEDGFGLDMARVLLGKFVGRISLKIGWVNTTSAATVTLTFRDDADNAVGSVVLANVETNAGAPVWETRTEKFAVPATATKVRLSMQARSPVGDGDAGIGFDQVEFHIYDAERYSAGDPVIAFGIAATVWNTTPGIYTIDDSLIWKALGAFVDFDVVSAVPNDKTIRGTNIVGAAGAYDTAAILWLSGANAGLKNLVRLWNPALKDIKLYYKPIHPVSVGDRFMYKRSCQRRFVEDCVLQFDNGINFRGFPHLPGKFNEA